MLEAVLRLANVAVVPEGDRFAFAVPPSLAQGLPRYDAVAMTAKARPDLGPNSFRLGGTSPQGLLDLYAGVAGRKATPANANLPNTAFYFRSTGQLTPGETIFVIEALASLNGLEFVFPDETHVSLQRIESR